MAWIVLGVTTLVAMVAGGVWFMWARPGRADFFELAGTPLCYSNEPGRAVVTIPVGLSNPERGRYVVDDVQLVEPEDLEVVGWRLVRSPRGIPAPLTGVQEAAIAKSDDHYEYVDGEGYWVQAVIQASGAVGAAESVELLSIPGEPAFLDDLRIGVSLNATDCDIRVLKASTAG